MGACHSTRAHPTHTTHSHPSSSTQTHTQTGIYPVPHAHTQVQTQVHSPFRARAPPVVVINRPPVVVDGIPRRRYTGKVVVKAVECTPKGKYVTRTYHEYGGKKGKKVVHVRK